MTPHEILIAARAKIEKPENWTQGGLARNTEGHVVEATSPKAVCWCSVGACVAVIAGASVHWFVARVVCNALYRAANGTIRFNDSHTHEEVLALFDRAIEATAP